MNTNLNSCTHPLDHIIQPVGYKGVKWCRKCGAFWYKEGARIASQVGSDEWASPMNVSVPLHYHAEALLAVMSEHTGKPIEEVMWDALKLFWQQECNKPKPDNWQPKTRWGEGGHSR